MYNPRRGSRCVITSLVGVKSDNRRRCKGGWLLYFTLYFCITYNRPIWMTEAHMGNTGVSCWMMFHLAYIWISLSLASRSPIILNFWPTVSVLFESVGYSIASRSNKRQTWPTFAVCIHSQSGVGGCRYGNRIMGLFQFYPVYRERKWKL